ncbi:MAG: HAD family hydrolase [Treponema sp.]
MNKRHSYIVCIDSDGCVMDSMNYKHCMFFGPCAADEWRICNRERFLELWNEVNLFSLTRGVNRFKGLYLTFEKMHTEDSSVPLLPAVENWCARAKALSNDCLAQEIAQTGNGELQKALHWSKTVNIGIQTASESGKPFDRAAEVLAYLKQFADIAVVSSANSEALQEEWTRYNLLRYTDCVMGQEQGSKADCIQRILQEGYTKKAVLVVGDSPGDLEAARTHAVFFYPILANAENASWAALQDSYFKRFLDNEYAAVQEELIARFNGNL